MTTQHTPSADAPITSVPEQASASASRWDKSQPMGLEIPFLALLGFELTVFEDGLSELLYVPKPEHRNSFDITHGGAVMTLLDAAMAVACRSFQTEMGVVTIEMKTSFMQPAVGPLTAMGELLHRTATLAFTQATVHNAAGDLCAHATGTYKYAKRLPVGRNIVSPVVSPKVGT
jgi:uncharacterized protein (TIGR00369 family)